MSGRTPWPLRSPRRPLASWACPPRLATVSGTCTRSTCWTSTGHPSAHRKWRRDSIMSS